MPQTPLSRSRLEFPGLPQKILSYFELGRADRSGAALSTRTVQGFITDHRATYPTIVQPAIVVEICRRLVARGWMSVVREGGLQGLENSYLCVAKDSAAGFETPGMARFLACAVYGFPAVYETYAGSVLPLVHVDKRSNQQIGTCFVAHEACLITALHCIQGAARLSVRDVPAGALQQATVISHPNEMLDLAAILLPEPVLRDLAPIPIPSAPPDILEEVMALGYPNVPGFHPSLAAEAASISGRLTSTRGRIASAPWEYFAKEDLLLITARVRGGFSGGPVLDGYGQLAGVVSREPAADANLGEGHHYDDLGYGVAIPPFRVSEMMRAHASGDAGAPDMADTTWCEFD